jgi:hypothetical protein
MAPGTNRRVHVALPLDVRRLASSDERTRQVND